MPYFISLFTGTVRAFSVMGCVFFDKMMSDLIPLVENNFAVMPTQAGLLLIASKRACP
tara:strand:- start:1635 stop:1808 length:174 start_codon:yes stop_codon:yes gene_type:complete